jgi:hypothetical protein
VFALVKEFQLFYRYPLSFLCRKIKFLSFRANFHHSGILGQNIPANKARNRPCSSSRAERKPHWPEFFASFQKDRCPGFGKWHLSLLRQRTVVFPPHIGKGSNQGTGFSRAVRTPCRFGLQPRLSLADLSLVLPTTIDPAPIRFEIDRIQIAARKTPKPDCKP